MIYCTFAGHREILLEGIEEKLNIALEKLMEQDDAFCFYTGGMGEFDQMCAHAIRRNKRKYNEKSIILVLVEPYMKQSINTDKYRLTEQYDDIIVPTDWVDSHYKRAITYRNRWMIDHSRYLIACVYRCHGGAYASVKYAEKRGLIIENLCGDYTERKDS